jgi:Glutamine amidotransferase domain
MSVSRRLSYDHREASVTGSGESIVGYVGKARCTEVLLKGLSHLEYRGYDSAGLALHTDSGIEQLRRVGRLNRLNEAVKEHDADFIRVRAGVGHTRWATHGRPTETNAHPHLGGEGTVAVVHNGIIENHAKLRDKLERDGYEFRSETDTEVIAHLIAHEMRKDATLREAMAEALRRFEGSFAVAAVSIAEPETIVAARSHSPLVIGLGEGESWEEGYSERRPSPTSSRPRPAARKWWSLPERVIRRRRMPPAVCCAFRRRRRYWSLSFRSFRCNFSLTASPKRAPSTWTSRATSPRAPPSNDHDNRFSDFGECRKEMEVLPLMQRKGKAKEKEKRI